MSIAQTTKTKRITLTEASNGMVMTPKEFDAVTDYDDLFVYELIHGVLIVSPIPGESERDPNEELGFLLRNHQYNHPQGSILDKTLSEQYIALPDSRRRADRVIWLGLGRVPDPRNDVPSIVVEFVSKRKRDRVRDYEEKRREYRAIGVSEYWVIDRFDNTMTVFKKTSTSATGTVIKADETYRTPLLPGFELPLRQLLNVAADWTKSQTQRKGKKSPEPPK
jgi:Uma2 family endonuclease